jgi:hypothetical protein
MITTTSRARRLLLCLFVVATLVTAAFATTVWAAATPVPFFHQETDVGQNVDPQPCNGVAGTTFTNTITEQGHIVTNADGTFHVFFISTQNIREDWIDGTYLIHEAVGPQSFNVNPKGNQTFSGTEQDRGTLYSATGQALGPVVIAAEFHYTFIDGVFVSNAFHFRIVRSPC